MMSAFLVLATKHFAIVLVRQFHSIVAKPGAAPARFTLGLRPLQFLFGVEVVTRIAGILALLDDAQLLLMRFLAGQVVRSYRLVRPV